MRKSQRKFVGSVVMLAFVLVYALIVMVLAQAPAIQHAPGYVQFFAYAVIGLAWVIPLMPLIKWMERD